jgi:polyphosphate kinase
VAYGVVGFKAHAKMLLIVRREGKRLRRYTHLGTGNYNERTARTYTDFGYMTANDKIGEDVHNLFQQLTGLGKVRRLNKLVQTPFGLHEQLLGWIAEETERAEAGEPARIVAKVNSLVEQGLIDALYEASQAGVEVDLIVRGACCLRPGMPGISDNIRVRSIVGRFLEHHRIFYFLAGGKEVVLAGSADWMPRNLFRRVEVCFPVESRKLKQRIIDEGLMIFLEHDAGAHEMQADGEYKRLSPRDEEDRPAQEILLGDLAGHSF